MKIEEYKELVRIAEESLATTKKQLAIKYAQSNNPYKIGDVVSDGVTTIKIEAIVTYHDYSNPSCVYKGVELKKDLTPKKKGIKSSVYQMRIKP